MVTSELNSRLIQHVSRVVSSRQISQNAYIHEYESPKIAETARPGQFVQIRITRGFSPFLPRPMSVLDVDKDRGTISVLFKVFGVATALLAEKKAGDTVGLLGPLGNTFQTRPYINLFLIAGGIGLPPLYFLAKSLNLSDFNVHLFFGSSTKEELFLVEVLQKMNIRIEFTTDDGSFGTKGLVTHRLEQLLKKNVKLTEHCLFACGPMAMIAEVQRISFAYNIPAQLSVETIMACGIGICQGCVLPKRGNDGRCDGYRLVCTEGPVFSENDLVIEND